MVDETEREKPLRRSADLREPELPKALAELDEAERLAETAEGATTQRPDRDSAPEAAEVLSRDSAPGTAAEQTAPAKIPSAARERDEPTMRNERGADGNGSPADTPAGARAESPSADNQPADMAEKTPPAHEQPEPPTGWPVAEREEKGAEEESAQPGTSGARAAPADEKHSADKAEPAGEAPDASGAGVPQPSEREPETPPRRESAVALAEIPGLPAPPPADTRDRPKGIVQAPKAERDNPAEVRGRWRQTGKNNRPDFLPGGYEASILLFRPQGILEVQRTFGKDGAILLTWEVGYKWNKTRSVLTLGEEAEFRPPSQSLKGFKAGEVVIKSAVRPFPVALPCVRGDDGTIRLGKKVYVPVKETGNRAAPDKGEPKTKAPSLEGSSGQD